MLGGTRKAVGMWPDRPLLWGRKPCLHGRLCAIRLAVPGRGCLYSLGKGCKNQLLWHDKQGQRVPFLDDVRKHRRQLHLPGTWHAVFTGTQANFLGFGQRQGPHLQGCPGAHGLLAGKGTLPFLPPAILPRIEHIGDCVAKTKKGVVETGRLCGTGCSFLCSQPLFG